MRKKIAVTLITLLAVIGFATPASANVIHNTSENSIALFQCVNYGCTKWQSSFNNIYQHTSGGITACLNIAPAAWPNGDPINDNSGSMVINGDPSSSNVWSYYTIYVFNWANCNPDGDWSSFLGSHEYSAPDLSTVAYQSSERSMYHTITSIGLIAN